MISASTAENSFCHTHNTHTRHTGHARHTQAHGTIVLSSDDKNALFVLRRRRLSVAAQAQTKARMIACVAATVSFRGSTSANQDKIYSIISATATQTATQHSIQRATCACWHPSDRALTAYSASYSIPLQHSATASHNNYKTVTTQYTARAIAEQCNGNASMFIASVGSRRPRVFTASVGSRRPRTGL